MIIDQQASAEPVRCRDDLEHYARTRVGLTGCACIPPTPVPSGGMPRSGDAHDMSGAVLGGLVLFALGAFTAIWALVIFT